MARNNCGCNFNVKCVGSCDVTRLNFDGTKRESLNWTELSVPEILTIPTRKPDIEDIDQVYANVSMNCVKLIETPFAYKCYDVLITEEDKNIFYDLAGDPLIDITALEASLTTIIGTDATGILGIVNLITDAIAVGVSIPSAVQCALDIVNSIVQQIDPLVTTSLTSLLSNAIDDLYVILQLNNLTPSILCPAIDSVKDLTNKLINVIKTIISALQNLIDSAVRCVVGFTPTAANLIIGAITPTITTALTELQGFLDVIANVDYCEKTKAFEIIENAEGTCLSGRKLIIEGQLNQKLVYTADADVQSVHSANFEMPFIAFIIPYAKFEGLEYEENIQVVDPETCETTTINGFKYDPNKGINIDLSEDFCVNPYIEDIYVYRLDNRTVFKNVTVFIKAKASKEYPEC